MATGIAGTPKRDWTRWRPLLQWMLFTASVATVPLGLRFVIKGVFKDQWNLTAPIEKGELYLIAIAFSAEIFGEMAFANTKMFKQMALSFTAMMLMVFSVGFFAVMDSLYLFNGQGPSTPALIVKSSVCLSVLSWMTGVVLRWPD